MEAMLAQLNVSPGGMPKLAVPEALVSRDGVAGDWQLNRKHHGGPDRAVCLYSVELYDWLAEKHDIRLEYGSVGENFTTRGVDLQQRSAGDQLRVGACTIEITNVRVPCRNLNRWHPKLLAIINGRSGWVAKVIEEAIVRPGDPITLMNGQSGEKAGVYEHGNERLF